MSLRKLREQSGKSRADEKYLQKKRYVTAQLVLSLTSLTCGIVGLIVALICILS